MVSNETFGSAQQQGGSARRSERLLELEGLTFQEVLVVDATTTTRILQKGHPVAVMEDIQIEVAEIAEEAVVAVDASLCKL